MATVLMELGHRGRGTGGNRSRPRQKVQREHIGGSWGPKAPAWEKHFVNGVNMVRVADPGGEAVKLASISFVFIANNQLQEKDDPKDRDRGWLLCRVHGLERHLGGPHGEELEQKLQRE